MEKNAMQDREGNNRNRSLLINVVLTISALSIVAAMLGTRNDHIDGKVVPLVLMIVTPFLWLFTAAGDLRKPMAVGIVWYVAVTIAAAIRFNGDSGWVATYITLAVLLVVAFALLMIRTIQAQDEAEGRPTV